LISKEQLDAVQLRARTAAETLRSADFAVSNARYELEVAQASLLQAQGGGSGGQAITLRSPIDGVVLQRLRESEAIVPPGEPLMEIADPAQLEIVSDYLSTDAVRIRRGQPVLIEQWGGDRALAGRVRRVEPFGFTKISALGVEEQRVNVVIDFEDVREAWEALGDGYRVEVRVITWDEGDVLKVPTSSLFRDGAAWAVYAVTLNTAALTHVEIGQRNGLEAQIITGLSAGDQVIAYPSDAIADGVEVVARD
jgi:HlyD family secretion protein